MIAAEALASLDEHWVAVDLLRHVLGQPGLRRGDSVLAEEDVRVVLVGRVLDHITVG